MPMLSKRLLTDSNRTRPASGSRHFFPSKFGLRTLIVHGFALACIAALLAAGEVDAQTPEAFIPRSRSGELHPAIPHPVNSTCAKIPRAPPILVTEAAAPAIAAHNVIKQFGRFAALRGVTAEFDAGRLHAILGDNGAGKTTLLRALAGLADPTRGEITIFGKTPRAACREIGYMAHPSLLYDEMSGMENLRYFAGLYGIQGDSRCEEVIRAVGLDPDLTRQVGQYSQGMRQRMSLARAILHDPKILLLDEPFSNVDIHSAQAMVALLKSMRDAGKTIFVVTHQAALLEGAADEFVWMQAGQIVSRTESIS